MLIKKQNQNATFPKRTLPLLANEIAERFSYYGLAAILPLFLKDHFYNGSETEAASVLHLWKSSVYFFPIIGAIIADVFLGKYRTILIGSMLCCMGHLLLSISLDNFNLFLAGMFLIAISAGIIKSNVSPFLGNQVEGQKNSQLSTLMNYLYLSINLGGAASQICLPYVREHYGNAIAFVLPGLAMLVALIVFWIPNKSYKKDKGIGVSEFGKLFSKENLVGIKKACVLFLFVIVYFMLYENSSVAFVYQAEHLNLNFGSFALTADQIQSSNPILILLLIPVFTTIVFPFLKSKFGVELSLFQKIKIGFALMTIAFIIVIAIQNGINNGGHPHAFWQLLAYFFLTASEILVSVSCLEYAYRVAGPNVKSIVTSLYLLSVSIGNLLVSWITSQIHSGNLKFLDINEIGTNYYLLLLGLMVVNSIIFFYAFASKTDNQQSQPVMS